MRKLVTLLGMAVLFSVFAFAEDFTGKLIDGACYDQHKSAKNCDATSSTAQFILEVSGKAYHLDEGGNAKAAQAMKSRADRSANPAQPSAGPVNAKVSGTPQGETIKVDMIEVQ